MSDPRQRSFARWMVWQTCLYVLASPIYVVRFFARNVRRVTGFWASRRGEVICPHCRAANAMDVLATCRRCGMTEFGSRLYCSNCHQVTRAFPCGTCQAMIRVL